MFIHYINTPIGLLKLTATDEALLGCARASTRERSTPNAVTSQAAAQLAEYFSGMRRVFSVPLSPAGTAFQRRVWAALGRVGFGETTHYGALAGCVGNPKAARAVGGAVGKNPLLLFIPCHRVLAAGGRLGGFSAGLDAKRALLALEHISWCEKTGNSGL